MVPVFSWDRNTGNFFLCPIIQKVTLHKLTSHKEFLECGHLKTIGRRQVTKVTGPGSQSWILGLQIRCLPLMEPRLSQETLLTQQAQAAMWTVMERSAP